MNRLRPFTLVFAVLASPIAATGMASAPAFAQSEAAAQELLADAQRRLSRNPTNLRALVDAGNASLMLDDVNEALGYFNRAQREDPNDGAMLVGLGQVAVLRGEGAIAVQLFDNAEAAGQRMNDVAAMRGLAYDLVGNNSRAQRFYRQALSRDQSTDVLRMLALSYAIDGDADASETTLLPLLQRQDRAAFRTRAFALAILGRDDEAIAITETMLPARLSTRLEPYLRYMPRLTRAQQAAAANLGRFPQASNIGTDTAQIAALASAADLESRSVSQAAQPSAGSDRLTPSGEPLGPRAQQPVVQGPVVQQPVYQAQPDGNGELPALATADRPASTPASASASALVTQPQASQPVTVATLGEEPEFPPAEEARPSFSVSQPIEQPASPAVEAVIAATENRSEEQLGLEEAFADFVLPAGNAVTPRQGAVDITAIQPAREAPRPATPPPPAPPAHPSRHWVQVATGQDLSAFRFDWRRLQRNSNGLLEGRDAFTAPWNASNRLVTGPFDSARAANEFVSELAEAGIDAFRFTSAEGEEVRELD